MKLPILIDPHVHLRDPGQTEKEDFYTGTLAALAGGFGYIFDMPNNVKPVFSEEILNEKIKIAKSKTVCNIGFYFGSLADNIDEFEIVKNKVFGLKIFLNQTTGGYILDKKNLTKIFTSWTTDKPILFHAESDALALVIDVLKHNKRPIHICHLSNQEELELVIKAKKDMLPVTCGATPHHLFLDESLVNKNDPYTKMKPPIQKKSDREFLWKNLDYIDCIESDHAPHTREEKLSENPPYGVPNLETTLPILLTKVNEDKISIDEVTRLLHHGPKKILNLKTNPNDYIEVDMNSKWVISNKNLYTKCEWTPYDGWKVQGKLTKVSLNNKVVFLNDTVKVEKGSGKVL